MELHYEKAKQQPDDDGALNLLSSSDMENNSDDDNRLEDALEEYEIKQIYTPSPSKPDIRATIETGEYKKLDKYSKEFYSLD